MQPPKSATPQPQPAIKRAVIISFDRFHTGYLGCYGNDWIETPHLDRLATESIVFDGHFCDNLDPAAANHAWWTGRCQFPLDADAQRDCRQFCEDLRAANVRTSLLVETDGSDDPMVAPSFDDLAAVRGTDALETSESETPFARLVQRACEWLDESASRQGPELLWIKSRGIPAPWLPPRGFADLYLDEFGLAAENDSDPDGDADQDIDDEGAASERDQAEVEDAAPPAGRDTDEPDESLDWRCAAAMYAAYATLLDRWFGKLAAKLAAVPEWADALLIVCAGSGQSLGEHARVSDEQPILRAESAQAPLWVRLPGSDQSATRRGALVQATDLAPTLLDWFGAAVAQTQPNDSPLAGRSLLPLIRNERPAIREALLLGVGRREWGIRTSEFFYVEPGDGQAAETAGPAFLFEKPQDRWDQCDVLSQYPQIAEELHDRLRHSLDSAAR